MSKTDEELDAEAAAEIVVKTTSDEIAIIGDDGYIAMSTADKHLARAIAVRLVELATELPEAPRLLRRPTSVDDELKEMDQ
ncbi:hypothetical protein [Microbacterium sp. TPD7012]|uniref:hypothetical protein n=1 Tax=Microbacterium sp. TPD7012 TaxID=2171975 RepID=UPI000D51180F|nr:hypothetical protein [Microbacterium sp. TPD7012]PVE95012.1 hypothetical protein DC434_13895 [Microbacterium sp. TPD7012]